MPLNNPSLHLFPPVKGNLKGETTTFHPVSRFCKGFEAPGGRWNVLWKNYQYSSILTEMNDIM
ncbi:MAG: hypothetical protein LBK45_06610 [Tannerellaceae bacterium]|jgi:hypothetical protein|nr:hypothetical protein [Tannerellaceae bacterium]